MKINIPYLLCISIFFTACGSGEDHSQNLRAKEDARLQELIDKYPDSFALKDQLIGYFQQNNENEKALHTIEQFIKSDSLNDRLWNMKAAFYNETDDTMQAIRSLEKAIWLKPSPSYFLSLGQLYAETKNAAALRVANQLDHIPAAGYADQAQFIRGLYYSFSGDYHKAITYFDQCIQLNFYDMFAYREKAIALYNLKNYKEALQVLQTSITVKPGFDEGYYWSGRCYEKLNDKNKAIENYKTALQLDSSFVEAQQALDKLSVK